LSHNGRGTLTGLSQSPLEEVETASIVTTAPIQT
jgi:hypothetical protein